MEFLLPILGVGAVLSLVKAKSKYTENKDRKLYAQLKADIDARKIKDRLEKEEEMRAEAKALAAESKLEAERVAYLRLRREREALERKMNII